MVTIRNDKTDDNEPILDPKLQDQLRIELYGTGLLDDSLVLSHTKSVDDGNSKVNLTSGMLVVGASMLGLVGMQIPFLFIKHAPFMATPARKIQNALKFIDRKRSVASGLSASLSSSSSLLSSSSVSTTSRRLSPAPKPPVFVDLGSGDGQAVYEAAKLGHTSVGIEFNWTLWAFSSLRRQFFWSSDVKR